jgi:hypothetical protein
MISLVSLTLVLTAAQPAWHADYGQARAQAIKDKRDLLIYFRDDAGRLDDVLADPEVKKALGQYVCLRVPESYQLKSKRLLDYDALGEMMGKPGLAVVSYHDKQLPFHEEVISAHALVPSHYGWVPDYGVAQVRTILDLPPKATLTQRSMMYAVCVHPEQPRSVHGHCHPAFLGHAQRHSARQAEMRHQHHADIIAASSHLQGEVGEAIGGASEVVAESWGRVVGGENVLEAAFSCVDAWRHSSGHWGAVSRAHRYFGYDIARGANDTWYATGIFAD